jgi:hypothetical protein
VTRLLIKIHWPASLSRTLRRITSGRKDQTGTVMLRCWRIMGLV